MFQRYHSNLPAPSENWGLEDPSGKNDEAFLEIIRLIEEKVLDLRERMK